MWRTAPTVVRFRSSDHVGMIFYGRACLPKGSAHFVLGLAACAFGHGEVVQVGLQMGGVLRLCCIDFVSQTQLSAGNERCGPALYGSKSGPWMRGWLLAIASVLGSLPVASDCADAPTWAASNLSCATFAARGLCATHGHLDYAGAANDVCCECGGGALAERSCLHRTR